MDEQKEIPLLDCPVDYMVGDASGKLMNEYGRFPCKIMCGTFALMVRGRARATVNINETEFRENDWLYIEPGSFLLIHEFSEDALVYYVLFSSAFLEKNTFNTRISFETIGRHNPVVHLKDDVAKVHRKLVEVLIDGMNCDPTVLNTEKMVQVFNLLQITYMEYLRKHDNVIRPQDRKMEIYYLYSKMVMAHYHEWHHVAQYADEMRLTLPHLCSTIKQVSGKTAGDLINEAILTAAKSQLKITNMQVKEIAMSLGFDNVAFFNRFFKALVGVTPKTYRHS